MKKIFRILLAVALVFGMAANVDAAKKRTKSRKTRTTAAAPAVIKGDTKSYGDDLTTQMFSIKKGETQISVEYPISGDSRLLQALRSQIANDLIYDYEAGTPKDITISLDNPEALLKAAVKPYNKKCTPMGEICQTLELDIKVIYSNDHVITIGEEGYWYGGGAHGMPIAYGYTFLRDGGEMLTNSMLPPIGTTRAYVVEALEKNIEIPSREWRDTGITSPYELEYPSAEAYVDANGLNLQYGAYEIGPFSLGIPKATIPLQAARKMVAGSAAAGFLK